MSQKGIGRQFFFSIQTTSCLIELIRSSSRLFLIAIYGWFSVDWTNLRLNNSQISALLTFRRELRSCYHSAVRLGITKIDADNIILKSPNSLEELGSIKL